MTSVGGGQFRAARRAIGRGVTLLEVLFSMGIVTVGLLGVMIIVPLAGSRSAQGTIADGADRLGRNAIRAFDVYQMRRPDSWSKYDPTNNNYQAYYGGEAFCIDPLYMAANVGTAGIFRFPYLGTGTPPAGIPWMERISLCTRPGATLPSVLPGTAGSRIMNVEQAGQIFLGGDDLVFSLPEDRTLPPQQKFDSSVTKRQWEGKFSWLATLVPKQGTGNKLYLLSIVVFHRRDPTADAERRVDVEVIDGNQYKLAARAGQPSTDLKVSEGEWILMTGMVGTQESFQWHRVDGVKAILPAGEPDFDNVTSTVDTRWVSTFGRDWLLPPSNTQVVLFDQIVAVYEKTIYLETSSIWTNL
jgi:hypothetical protein